MTELGVIALVVAPVLTYLIGRWQQVDNLRVAEALPRAEKIATLLQEVHEEAVSLARWWQGNMTALSRQQGLERATSDPFYEGERERLTGLSEKRRQLREAVRAARIYLNADSLDLIEEYLALGDFTYSHDGMGGILFTGYFSAAWTNVLDEDRSAKREALFQKLKKSLQRMHRQGRFW